MSALAIAQQTLTEPLQVPQEFLSLLAERYSGQEFDVDELMEDPDLLKYLKTKGRRKTARKTPPAEERRGEYDAEKCGARIWLAVRGMKNTGYSDIQCSSKHTDGCFCKKHARQWEEGTLCCGKITEDPPEDPVFTARNGDQKDMIWFAEDEGEERLNRGGVQKPTKASLAKQVDDGETTAKKKVTPKKGATKKKATPKKTAKKTPSKADEGTQEKKPRGRPRKKKDDEEKVTKKKKSPPKKEKELGEKDAAEMSVAELRAALAAKEMVRRLSVDEGQQDELDEDTEGMSDGSEEDELETIDFEGVEYLMDPGSKVVSDPATMERVGTWDPQEEEVDFDDEDGFTQHCEERDA